MNVCGKQTCASKQSSGIKICQPVFLLDLVDHKTGNQQSYKAMPSKKTRVTILGTRFVVTHL